VSIRVMCSFLQDLKYALRVLGRNPGFTGVTVLTLALGVGSTTTVPSLVQGVLLTPPPYPRPDRIVRVLPVRADGAPHGRGVAAAQWRRWKEESRSFAALAAYSWTFDFLILPDGSESLQGMWTTPDYFRVVGLQPLLGRIFSENEAGPKPSPVVVLGYDLWRRRFGSDTNVIGRTIRLSRSEESLTVIGVMPPKVRNLPSPTEVAEPNYDLNARTEFWVPASANKPDPKTPCGTSWAGCVTA